VPCFHLYHGAAALLPWRGGAATMARRRCYHGEAACYHAWLRCSHGAAALQQVGGGDAIGGVRLC
jgi:hypothetical protein